MAFMGMVFAAAFVIIFIIHISLMTLFFILAIVLKIVGKVKDSKKMKKAGTVFLVLGILFAAPIIAFALYFAFQSIFWAVTDPDGSTKYVLTQDVAAMKSYAENPDEDSVKALDELLDKDSRLVFWHDNNYYSVLDIGLQVGSADVVRVALEHGAIFDNPERYDHMSYVSTSMDYYLNICIDRSITGDDIEIAKMMFENNASMKLKRPRDYFSNVFGKAVWAVLYNDDAVTDTELEFIRVFIDNGYSSDADFLLLEDVPSNNHFTQEYYDHADSIAGTKNYDRIMAIISK
ncbi:MAG: hypothetical protein J1F11_03655 [Oscillospiraceae bacterium]|nr:hypothetical protein [Oscillospiraceae bacterium]